MEKWSEHNSKVVSKDTAELSREEKGVVSSVFAKVIEGAEILQRILSNIDAKICKTHDKQNNTSGKCNLSAGSAAVSQGATGPGNPDGLSKWFDEENQDCKHHDASNKEQNASSITDNKCTQGKSSGKGLSDWFDATNTDWNNGQKGTEKWHAHNTKTVPPRGYCQKILRKRSALPESAAVQIDYRHEL